MTRQLKPWMLVQIVFVFFLAGCSASAQNKDPHIIGSTVQKIYWSDGDSGRLDGIKFRLANVDAPETGSLKQRGGAKCELEREKGYDVKAYLVNLTQSGTVKVVRDYGYDRYKRLVVDLSVDGQDVGMLSVTEGVLKAWPHRKGRALAPKPDWCELDG